MNYDTPKPPMGYENCPPPQVDPADQPKPPCQPKPTEQGKEPEKCCQDLPQYDPPKWEPPAPCPPDERCECPPVPGSDPSCLTDLITTTAGQIEEGKKADAFKKDLEALAKAANGALQDYTQDKYSKLVKQWVQEDEDIANLIKTLVCDLPCWYCVIECYVCPLLNRMHEAEERLKWDPTKYPNAYNRYDLLNWYTQDKWVKERRFNRIKSVLAAWEKPAQTIEKILTDNAKLIVDLKKTIGPQIVFDLFFRLIPLHLAIAPPKGSAWTTKIDKQYTKFCPCDVPSPDDCCGPDVGLVEWSLRQRLIGPQPYLIDPNDYLKIICCLVKERYGPAQEALAKVETQLLTIEADIKRDKELVENGLKSFDKDARGAIPTTVDCCTFKPTQNQGAS
jgi:hypothetical protein